MDLLLGLLLDAAGGIAFEIVWELLRLLGRGALALLLPNRPRPGPHPLVVAIGAIVAGAALGATSAHLLPARVLPTGAATVATWLALPLGAGLAAWCFDHLRGEDRRAPPQAVLSGVLFGLAYLALRAVARGAPGG